MANWTAPAFAAALGLASGSAALAVDLPPAPTLPAETPSVEDFSGWCLRSDLGVGFEAARDPGALAIRSAPNFPGSLLSPFAVASFGDAALSPSGTIDGGVGYVFNTWLRADATVEYRFGARLSAPYAIDDPTSLTAAGHLRGGVSSIVALVNGYVDLGEYWGATPFVGAGIGVADNALSGVSDQGLAVSNAGSAVPIGGLFSDTSKTNFAWALIAGLDFDVAPNLKLELSYRYLNLGAIAVGVAHCFAGAVACASGAVVASPRGALISSDVRIGLIWLVGDSPAVRARD